MEGNGCTLPRVLARIGGEEKSGCWAGVGDRVESTTLEAPPRSRSRDPLFELDGGSRGSAISPSWAEARRGDRAPYHGVAFYLHFLLRGEGEVRRQGGQGGSDTLLGREQKRCREG